MTVLYVQLWRTPGTVAYTSRFIQRLVRRDDIRLVLAVPRRFPQDSLPSNIDLIQVDAPQEFSRRSIGALLKQPISVPSFLMTLVKVKANVLHQNFAHPWMTVLLPLLSKRYPYVQTLHDAAPHPGEQTFRSRLAISAACKYATRLIVHGKRISEFLIQQRGVEPGRIAVIPHGDYAFYTNYGDKSIQTEPQTILFFGRLLPYKGLDVLLDAFSTVLRTLPHAHLIVAGPGDIKPYESKLRALQPHLELHNRTISDDEVANFYRRATVVAIPYLEGSQSGPLIISLGFRKPVVATDVGCFSEIVNDGETGVLVPPGDAERFAAALLRVLTSPAEAADMGQRAYDKMRAELDWDRIVDMTVQVYRSAMESKR